VELVSSFKYLGICFSKDVGRQEDVKMIVDEGLKTFGAVMINVKSVAWV